MALVYNQAAPLRHRVRRGSGARFAGTLLWLALSGLFALELIEPSRGFAQPDPEAGLQAQVGACLGREDPQCAQPLLTQWQALQPTSPILAYSRGVVAFLSGRLEAARSDLQSAAGAAQAPSQLREDAQRYLDLLESTAEVHRGAEPHPMVHGRVNVWLRPGPDQVMLPYLQRVLEKALPALDAAFGPVGTTPIDVYIYPRSEDLARVSGLTVEQIRTSGTIALCKYNRVMLTSPADLVFGYAWADTLNHELVHWYVIKRGGPQVPVWLHEGLARSFEGLWRGRPAEQFDMTERETLAKARKKGRFITLQKMSPSMALLPSQDDTQLAFAEVHHAVTWLLTRGSSGSAPPRAEMTAAQAGQLVGLFAAGLTETQVIQRFSGLQVAAFQSQWKRDLHKLELGDSGTSSANRVPLLVFRNANTPAAGSHNWGEQARKYAELGDRLAVLHRPQAAAVEYRKAIASGGGQDDPLLVARLVRVLLDLGRHAQAAEYLTPALQTWPQHAPLHVLQARLEAALSHWQAALDASDDAAWINPFDPSVHGVAAQAYAALGMQGDAAAAEQRQQKVATMATL